MPILKPYPSEKQKPTPSVGTAERTVRQKEAQLVVTSGKRKRKGKKDFSRTFLHKTLVTFWLENESWKS